MHRRGSPRQPGTVSVIRGLRRGIAAITAGLALSLLTALGACQPDVTPGMSASAPSADSTPGIRQRIAAISQSTDASALRDLAWRPHVPGSVRLAAMQRTATLDAPAFWPIAAGQLHREQDPRVLAWLCQNLPEAFRPAARLSLLTSLARPALAWDDPDRPEWAALGITPADQDRWLRGQLAKPGIPTREADALWQIAMRHWEPQTLRAWALDQPAGHFDESLRWAAEHLEVLPRRPDELRWLRAVITARDTSSQPTPRLPAITTQTPGLAARHLPGVLLGPPPQRAVQRVASMPGASAATPADRLLTAHIWHALSQPQVTAALFAQADADHADTTSEHGGALLTHPPVALAFDPLLRRGDRVYLPPPELFDQLLTDRGLAYYHFHAQEHDHAQHAGPGPGDRRTINRLGVTGLVLTFINRDTLRADLVLPDVQGIELGELSRPAS